MDKKGEGYDDDEKTGKSLLFDEGCNFSMLIDPPISLPPPHICGPSYWSMTKTPQGHTRWPSPRYFFSGYISFKKITSTTLFNTDIWKADEERGNNSGSRGKYRKPVLQIEDKETYQNVFDIQDLAQGFRFRK